MRFAPSDPVLLHSMERRGGRESGKRDGAMLGVVAREHFHLENLHHRARGHLLIVPG